MNFSNTTIQILFFKTKFLKIQFKTVGFYDSSIK